MDKFHNTRIFRSRIARLDNLSAYDKQRALNGIDRILSDQEYADHVEDDFSSQLFLCQYWWDRMDDGEIFWKAIDRALEDAELDVICKGDLQ